MTRDAKLHAITFVDQRHGWVVGDRGVLLRTTDGGRRWRLVEMPVDCSLHDVCFLDTRTGWVVGGSVKPYTHSSHAVMLVTQDGGDSWQKLPVETLPLLRRVQFFDQRRGIVLGQSEPFAPSGAFETRDGGRTWRPLATDQPCSWLAGDFLTLGAGALAGQQGLLSVVKGRDVLPTGAPPHERRSIRALRLLPPHGGWAAGDGGLVLATNDGGQRWRPPMGALPKAVQALCNWQAVAVDGPRVWIAGEPGSVVLHSPDAGHSWQLQPTGIATPLSAIHFTDAQHGWATGALGVILATTDGGRSWQVQRQGGNRLAVELLAPSLDAVPLDLVASLAAGEGYLCSIELPFAPRGLQASKRCLALREAALVCGATLTAASSRVTLPQGARAMSAQQLLAQLNQQAGGNAWPQVIKQTVLRLRMLRPEAVLLASENGQELPGAEALLESLAREAITAAADPEQFRELASLGLSPHQVRRLVRLAPGQPHSAPRLATGDFNSLLGTSPSQWVGANRGLLTRAYRQAPVSYTWRVVMETSNRVAAGRDPLAGMAIGRGSGARRPPASPPVGKLATLRAVSQKRRNMQQLLRQSEANDAWIGQAASLTSGLDTDSGAELLFQLANGYEQAGKRQLAADTFYLLLRRYTDHALADASILWLLHYYASDEAALAVKSRHASRDRSDSLANVPAGATPPRLVESNDFALSRTERLERARQLGTYLEQARPALFADPAVRFAIAAAQRGREGPNNAEKYTAVFVKQSIDPAWRRCAEAEQWLVGQRRGQPQKQVAICSHTAEKPLLDGHLSEPGWQDADSLPMGNSIAKLMYDAEFLYIAFQCRSHSMETATPQQPRPRDADLSMQDRVILQLDTNRDYATAFHLAIDSRGWTNERCWQDERWNPQWFVATGRSDQAWTAEAAIPLAELTDQTVDAQQVWAISLLHRTGHGFSASWSGEADASRPERFGLLLFR